MKQSKAMMEAFLYLFMVYCLVWSEPYVFVQYVSPLFEWNVVVFFTAHGICGWVCCWPVVVFNGWNWCLQSVLLCWWQYKACAQCSRASGQKNRAQHSLSQWTVGMWVALAAVCQELLNPTDCLLWQRTKAAVPHAKQFQPTLVFVSLCVNILLLSDQFDTSGSCSNIKLSVRA